MKNITALWHDDTPKFWFAGRHRHPYIGRVTADTAPEPITGQTSWWCPHDSSLYSVAGSPLPVQWHHERSEVFCSRHHSVRPPPWPFSEVPFQQLYCLSGPLLPPIMSTETQINNIRFIPFGYFIRYSNGSSHLSNHKLKKCYNSDAAKLRINSNKTYTMTNNFLFIVELDYFVFLHILSISHCSGYSLSSLASLTFVKLFGKKNARLKVAIWSGELHRTAVLCRWFCALSVSEQWNEELKALLLDSQLNGMSPSLH